MSPTRRRGLVLLEVLVLLGMAIVVVGLVLAAVPKVREAANRMACSNNLKMVALAAWNQNDTSGYVPSNPGTAGAYTGTTQYLLLPYME
jgi:hypothetical protein